MDITSLTVVLSVIVVVAASVLIAFNEPPLWVYLLSCAGSYPLGSALLGGPDFTSPIADGSMAAWGLRLAVASTVTVVLSFLFGKDCRAGAEADGTPPREPRLPEPARDSYEPRTSTQ
ncbi:hypothetical protein JHN63_10065 [Streptomyces sp. MBT65]|uniref:hypothetical protein n=1 Tax=Streptomyces sp. MBT65 TaxID=1488395 RepID=UPI00190BF4E4|nr:hypothetical protein [Streptomyces sp. MBT65]MBK3574161.1 hypothetical protein [Streptomyces sp. MBT65]